MTIEETIQLAAKGALRKELVESLCDKQNLSFVDFATEFSRQVAEKYIQGNYEWLFCDHAMNSLWGYSCVVLEEPMQGYAFKVFEAFDAAEYRREGDADDFDYESRTRELLDKLVERSKS